MTEYKEQGPDHRIIALKERLSTAGIRGLALDIDETLAWTVGHWAAELKRRFGGPEGMSVEEIVDKHKYTQHVPDWQTPEALAWMEEAREDDLLQAGLPLLSGAQETVLQIHEMVPFVAYLTTRPAGVLRGTERWLKDHGFPEAEVITRPTNMPLAEANKWKADALSLLYPQVMGIVDDNPGVTKNLPAG